MTAIRLRGKPIAATLNNWRRIDQNTHRCGNVQVVRRVDPKCKFRDDWRDLVRQRNTVGQMRQTLEGLGIVLKDGAQ